MGSQGVPVEIFFLCMACITSRASALTKLGSGVDKLCRGARLCDETRSNSFPLRREPECVLRNNHAGRRVMKKSFSHPPDVWHGACCNLRCSQAEGVSLDAKG